MLRPLVCLLPLGFALPGCSTLERSAEVTRTAATEVHGAVLREDAPESLDQVGRAGSLGDAVMTPVKDLNLRRVEVPEAVARVGYPYATTAPGGELSCELIALELAELDAALGPDYGAEMSEEERERLERAGLGLVSSAMGDLIPFRGVVREVSGAKREERALRAAYRRGVVRRGFLRGVAMAKDCG